VRQLLRHVVVYRGVFLYGESGAGKSSLINAGLVPAATEEGFRPDRVRVQPRPGQELVVERMPLSADGDVFLPTSFSDTDDGSPIVLSVEAFRGRVGAVTEDSRPLVIFDQFEELVTLFDEALDGEALEQGRRCQARVVDLIVELLRDETLPLKLLFVFREDYLAKVKKLLAARPELVDRSLRLTPPATEALQRIIRGPFDDHPDHFARELSPRLAERLSAEIASRASSGAINLSEVQIAALRLWQSADPEALLTKKGVQGILEEYLEESLNRFPQDLHYSAVALLGQLVTATGARNVVSADDLIERVRSEEKDVPEDRLRAALAALERDARLVRRERRRDLDLYEIVSEFLSPWIRRQRAQRLKDRELSRRLKKAGRLVAILAAGIAVAAALATTAVIFSLKASHRASVEKADAEAGLAFQELAVDPTDALQLAASAMRNADTPQAEAALRTALAQPQQLAVLGSGQEALDRAAFSRDGKRVFTRGFVNHIVRTWDVSTGKEIGTAVPFTAGSTADRALPDTAFAPRVRLGPHTTEIRASGRRPIVLPVASTAVTLSRDGKWVVTGGNDGAARVWDATTGSLIAVLRGHTSFVSGAGFGPTDDLIVTASADGTARVWRVALPTTRLLRGHVGPVNAAAFSPDGKRVVTADADNTARIWNTATGNEMGTPILSPRPLTWVAFSRDGSRIVTADTGGVRRVWDAGTERPLPGVAPEPATRDLTLRVNAVRNARVLVRTASGTTIVPARAGQVTAAYSSPDGKLVVTVSPYVAWIGEMGTGREVALLHSESGTLSGAGFSADGTLVATVGSDGALRVWQARAARQVVAVRGLEPDVTGVVFSADGARLLTFGPDALPAIQRCDVCMPIRALDALVRRRLSRNE
jgi:WD40 repeat protein